jgi:hypothetical protein
MFASNIDYHVCLIGKSSGSVVWKQPLIIEQNRYASSLLNDWDGSVKIGENFILSPYIAAGVKDERNTFTGVAMGYFSPEATDYDVSKIGLYGFQKGAESYGFKSDGTAFIGTSGKGRIYFDGNEGVIAGPCWWDSGEYDDLFADKINNGDILESSSDIEGGKFDFAKGHLELYGNDNGKRNYLVFRDGKLLI